VCISLQVIHSFTELGDVEIAVNGRPLATEVCQDVNGLQLRINTALERSCYTVLELHTPKMVRPSDRSDSTDDRLLGIVIGNIRLEPTQS
jgi:hypothetical protein